MIEDEHINMDNSKEIIKNRLKILKNPLVLILILGLVIRLFYIYLTSSYGMSGFWDSCLYGNYARYFSGHGPYVELAAVRPILFSLVWAGFNFFTLSEIPIRIFLLIFSMLAILGMYYLGKEMSNEYVGYIAALITSVFYIHIFYSIRLLVDTLSFTFFIWSALYFYKYFRDDKPKFFYIASIIVAIGFLFRITTALILMVVLFYTIIIHGLKMFKKKEYYIGAIIFLLIIAPYLIWGYYQFDGFVLIKALETNAPKAFWSGGLNVFIRYISQGLLLLPNNWAMPVAGLFVIGLFMMHGSIVGIDMARKGDKKLQKDLFLLLMFIIPLICISFLLDHDEDRYIFNVFPAIFVLTSIATISIKDWLNTKYGKIAANIFLIIIIALIIGSQIEATDRTVRGKMPAYQEVRQAGLWIKDNSNPGDIVVTQSYPQIQYYSMRYAQWFPSTEEEYEAMDKTNHRYFILSVFERSPEWIYSYPVKKNLTVANAWMSPDGQQPLIVIYNLE